jgi:hypothetical protein
MSWGDVIILSENHVKYRPEQRDVLSGIGIQLSVFDDQFSVRAELPRLTHGVADQRRSGLVATVSEQR